MLRNSHLAVLMLGFAAGMMEKATFSNFAGGTRRKAPPIEVAKPTPEDLQRKEEALTAAEAKRERRRQRNLKGN